jgi:spore coat polysaccharide biosynthesis protein SpsF (cytidylyltransferase family)
MRAKKLKVDKVILATTNRSWDAGFECFAENNGIECYRSNADVNDVQSRFVEILEKEKPDYFFRICGDSPLFDVELGNGLLDMAMHNKGIYYFSFSGCNNVTGIMTRYGIFIELVKSEAFLNIAKFNKEHITSFFYNHNCNNNMYYKYNIPVNFKVCVDTPYDLIYIKKLIEANGGVIPEKYTDIINIILKHPELEYTGCMEQKY